jgi:hypothetical protein
VVCGGAGFSLVCILLLSRQQQKLFFWLGLTGLLVFLFQLIAVILAFVLRNNIETDFNKVRKFSDINLKKDSSLLLRAIHSLFTGGSLKKTSRL